MQPKSLPQRQGPEAKIRADIIKFLQQRGWYVKIMHGSAYQSGIPDLYCTHAKYGPRWIEVKLPDMYGSRWTNAQREVFPLLSSNGSPIWILTGSTEQEYRKLFRPENWLEYYLIKD